MIINKEYTHIINSEVRTYLTENVNCTIATLIVSLTAFYLFIGKNEIQHPSHTLHHCKKRVPMFFFFWYMCLQEQQQTHFKTHR